MIAKDVASHGTLANLRQTYAACFSYLSVAGLAAVTEFAVFAYDGEVLRFVALGAGAIGVAALGAALAAPVIARFDPDGRDRTPLTIRTFLSAIALGAIACLPLTINHAVRAAPIARR